MKRYAVADEVPCSASTYLATGVEYEIALESKFGFAEIINSFNNRVTIRPESCQHLNGKSWRIVERE